MISVRWGTLPPGVCAFLGPEGTGDEADDALKFRLAAGPVGGAPRSAAGPLGGDLGADSPLTSRYEDGPEGGRGEMSRSGSGERPRIEGGRGELRRETDCDVMAEEMPDSRWGDGRLL